MSGTWIPIVVAVIASTGFWQFLQFLITKRQQKKSTDRKALLALLHDRLYYIMNHYIEHGHISSDEYENITYLYEPYIEMGGNGTCERLKKELDKLPIKD